MKRAGGRWIAFAALAVALLAPASSSAQDVCNRTQAVQEAIRNYFLTVNTDPRIREFIRDAPCSLVNQDLLDEVTVLDLSHKRLRTLRAGDFDGLRNLEVLFLHNNSLSSLPSGLFNDLSSIIGITLHNNNLSTLPFGLFNGLPLQVLHLHANQFQRLPAGIFSGLRGNGLNTLRTSEQQIDEVFQDLFDEDTYLGFRFDSNPRSAPRQHSISISMELVEDPAGFVGIRLRFREGLPGPTRLTLTVNGSQREYDFPVGVDVSTTYPYPDRMTVVLEEGTIGDPAIVNEFTGVNFSVARQVVRRGPEIPVSITASTAPITEGGTATFTLTSEVTASVVDHVVTVDVSGDGAGADERGTRQMTIPTGAHTATFTVNARVNDRLYLGNQTMTATVRSENGFVGRTPLSARVTVREDERPPTGVRLSVSREVVDEDAGATTVTVTASLTGGAPLAGASQVSATLSKTGRSGIATNPTQRFTIPIGAGSATGQATFTVTPTADRGAYGGDGTVTVGGTHSSLPVSPATVLVRDTFEPTISVSGGVGLTSQPESRPDGVRFSAAEGTSVTLTAASTGLPVSATFAWSQGRYDPVQLPLSRSARNRSALSLTLPNRSAAYTVQFAMTATHDPGGGAHVRTYTRWVTLAVSATDADPVIGEAVSEVEGVSEAGEIRVLPGTQVVLRGRASDADTDQRLTVAWRGLWGGARLVPVVAGQPQEVMFTASATSGRYVFTFSADDDGHGGDAPVTREVVVEVVSGRGVSIRPVSSRVFEDEMEGAMFEVRASMASTTPIVVNVNLSEEGGMFELEGGAQTVTIAANETTKRFTVPITDDDRQQRNGALRAEVAAGTGYLAVAPARARVRILDDESLVDVNADSAVDANDALILYYAWALRSDLGNGR